MVYNVSSYCPTLVFYLPNLNSPLTVRWKLLWKHSVTGRRYKRALLQSSVLFIKAAVMSQLCWIWIMDPVRPSLTPRERWRHAAAAAASPRRNEMLMHSWLCHRSAAHFLSVACARACFYLHTGMFLFAWVCLSANAHSCLSARANVGVSLFILTSVCVLVVCVCVCDFAERDH